jgi:hypothetical protein
MSIGISVNVGLNKVTSSVFHAAPLQGCENDARAMHAIAIKKNFDANRSKLLIGPDATLDKVVNAVTAAAEKLNSGDLFLFTFAGHGTFKIAPTAVEENDRHDESIVLADHLLIDNFWRNKLWPKFKPGVRALAVADCCHSGTIVLSGLMPAPSTASRPPRVNPTQKVEWRPRELADEEREKELAAFPNVYKKQLAPAAQVISCTRLFLSACLDNQKAADGPQNGAFTAALLNVWNNGGFTGNYNQFIDKIKEPFKNSRQTPNLTPFGSPDFRTQRPFTI